MQDYEIRFPLWLLYIPTEILSSTAKTVWAVIGNHLGDNQEEAWPSQKTISMESGLAISTIKKHTKKLVQLGLLSIRLVRDKNGANHNYYTLSAPQELLDYEKKILALWPGRYNETQDEILKLKDEIIAKLLVLWKDFLPSTNNLLIGGIGTNIRSGVGGKINAQNIKSEIETNIKSEIEANTRFEVETNLIVGVGTGTPSGNSSIGIPPLELPHTPVSPETILQPQDISHIKIDILSPRFTHLISSWEAGFKKLNIDTAKLIICDKLLAIQEQKTGLEIDIPLIIAASKVKNLKFQDLFLKSDRTWGWVEIQKRDRTVEITQPLIKTPLLTALQVAAKKYKKTWDVAEIQAIYQAYPLKKKRQPALIAIEKRLLNLRDECLNENPYEYLLSRVQLFAQSDDGKGQFCPHCTTWMNQARDTDNENEWNRKVISRSGNIERIIDETNHEDSVCQAISCESLMGL